MPKRSGGHHSRRRFSFVGVAATTVLRFTYFSRRFADTLGILSILQPRKASSAQALRFILGLAALSALPLLPLTSYTATSTTVSSGAFVIVFVDFSASTSADRQVYVDALQRVRQSLRPGDRLLVAPIGSSTLTSFEPIIDVSLEAITPKRWWDNPIEYSAYSDRVEKQDRVLLATQWAKLDHALAKPAVAQRSCIRASLMVASQAFAGEPRPHQSRVLLILSDMLEDCDGLDFEKQMPDAANTERLLERTVRAGELPSLAGVQVYVAGANAGSTEWFQAVERFWLAYLRKCGAIALDADYTHYLLNFAVHMHALPLSTESNALTAVAGRAPRTSCKPKWGLGSTESEVLASMGQPLDSRLGEASETWLYAHGSYVRFNERGKVVEFFNVGQLRSCR